LLLVCDGFRCLWRILFVYDVIDREVLLIAVFVVVVVVVVVIVVVVVAFLGCCFVDVVVV